MPCHPVQLLQQALQCGPALEINDFTGFFVERCTVVLGIIDIQADVDYILFHRRLRFCFMVGALQLTNLRYPSLMVALGSAKDGGVYIFSLLFS